MKPLIFLITLTFLAACSPLPTSQDIGLRFSTEKSRLPNDLQWREIGLAKELLHPKEKMVVISGGSNPIPLDKWDRYTPPWPYRKNLDRHLLFQQTAFYRSPQTEVNCQNNACIRTRTFDGYTWVELAKPICVDYVGGKTDILKPENGKLVIKTIQKCQAVRFTDSIFQLTDNQGNFYAMHATETGKPDTAVVLPRGWSLKKISLAEPLIISPFGGGNECYFNIIGDPLGQGYHQYIFANKFYPR